MRKINSVNMCKRLNQFSWRHVESRSVHSVENFDGHKLHKVQRQETNFEAAAPGLARSIVQAPSKDAVL